ncbi:hypothetical protein [Olleya sp. AS48]|uniref:hypothetical protein n=1 Tax=Olleya sp. AS48 TaxID=3135774 RepID=UPI00317F7439
MDINHYKKNALEFRDYYIDLYGIEPNFKTYLDNQAIATSKEHVKEKFEFYKMGWNLIGRDVSDAQEVYNWFYNIEGDFQKLAEEISLIGSIDKKKQLNKMRNLNDRLKQVDNNKMKEIHKEESNSLIDNFVIILIFINLVYFITEFVYRIFSNKAGIFYIWGYYDETYKLSGMLLLLSIFGLNHYYSRSKTLKQIIDDLWMNFQNLKK